MNKLFSKNKTTKQEQIDDFNIKYKKCIFSKTIRVSIKEKNSILVTMPKFCPYKVARNFLLENFDKLKKVNIKTKIYKESHKTKFDTLKIIKENSFKTEVKNKIVYFYYPNKYNFEDNTVQEKYKEALLLALKLEAKSYLSTRINFLAKKYNFNFKKLSLRNQKTRYGSCSYDNNINLNINLMNYDFEIIDYVIIHELCHTKIKNHSKDFWNEVEKICPNYKTLRNMLKKQ